MFDILIRGGRLVDGTGNPWYRADVGITGDRIAAIGALGQAQARVRLNAAGKIVAPGFVDAHVHGDLKLLTDPYHEPAIRQGVTTYILGQDGVAMAPASSATLQYMRQYTAGFSGIHDITPTWTSMADYLALFDRRCALNVACLVPNGNLRMEAMGLETRPPNGDELKIMGRLLREALEQGAVGLSTGLDYIPSRYAEVDELIALCREMAPYGGVYVTHMRRYDPDGVLGSMDEVYRIGKEAEVAVHISHFNSQGGLVIPKLDEGRRQCIEITFDLYCYLAGSTILSMITLPPWVQEGGIEATLRRLRDPAVRQKLRDPATLSRGPLENVRLTFVAAEEFRHFEGKTLQECATERQHTIGEFVCDVLVAANMVVGCIAPHRSRVPEDIDLLMQHECMMGGSDGIYTGSHPHPRGCGCFARYLGYYVRERKTWTLEQAVRKLAAHPASKFGLRDRGLLCPGLAADVIVFDPDTITDHSTYEEGRRLATGMEQVIVNGELVLHNGERTQLLPGRSLKRK